MKASSSRCCSVLLDARCAPAADGFGATMIRIVILVLALISISGCATHGQDRHFERNPALDAASKADTPDPDFASVYLIRSKMFAQAIIYTPVPPIYYAVDDRLVSIMPLGTFVHLKLAPGLHKFSLLRYSAGDFVFAPKVVQNDLTLTLEPGKKYYVSEHLSLLTGGSFRQLDQRDGASALADVELARLLYAPATVEAFKQRLLVPRESRASAPSAQSALPSENQVSDFFEGLATVALVALVVVGAALGASGSGGLVALEGKAPSPPAYYQQQAADRWSIRTSSGVTSEVSALGRETRLRNWSTGVTYTIADDRITGSDGSRYRIRGASIVSDTGEHFQKVGNAIFGSDGRSCDVIGSQIICRPAR
jgi:hypothetical protein